MKVLVRSIILIPASEMFALLLFVFMAGKYDQFYIKWLFPFIILLCLLIYIWLEIPNLTFARTFYVSIAASLLYVSLYWIVGFVWISSLVKDISIFSSYHFEKSLDLLLVLFLFHSTILLGTKGIRAVFVKFKKSSRDT